MFIRLMDWTDSESTINSEKIIAYGKTTMGKTWIEVDNKPYLEFAADAYDLLEALLVPWDMKKLEQHNADVARNTEQWLERIAGPVPRKDPSEAQ